MPGPAPKPTAMKILEGNRGHRPFNSREPTPLPGAPPMPRHLDKEARREWKRLVPILLSMRVLTEADGIALGNLCMTYSTLVRAQTMMLKSATGKQSSLLLRTPSGYFMQHPVLAIVNSQMAMLSGMLREFGLTPASRSRILTTSSPDDIDPLELKIC